MLDALKVDLQPELDFVANITRDHIKTYQAWCACASVPHYIDFNVVGRYHRRAIVTRIGSGASELAFTADILEQDSKNYHAWQHRLVRGGVRYCSELRSQWAIQQFDLFATLGSEGFAFVDALLTSDVRFVIFTN